MVVVRRTSSNSKSSKAICMLVRKWFGLNAGGAGPGLGLSLVLLLLLLLPFPIPVAAGW